MAQLRQGGSTESGASPVQLDSVCSCRTPRADESDAAKWRLEWQAQSRDAKGGCRKAMAELQHVFERLVGAVTLLALSPDSLQHRLAEAFIAEKLIVLDEPDFPEHLRNKFSELRNGMRDFGRRRIDRVVERMNDKEAEHYIRLILDLHQGIAKEVFCALGHKD